MKKMLIILIILITSLSIGAVTFSETFGGVEYDECKGVRQTADGGYIIVGSTNSFECQGTVDAWLIKTDAFGVQEWDSMIGGEDNDGAYSIEQTTDGGYIVAGTTMSFGAGYKDFWLIKTNATGNIEWENTFGGEQAEISTAVMQTTDGGYLIAGMTTSFGAGSYDFWLVKTDENGISEWDTSFGGEGEDSIYSAQQTTDGGYILAGQTDTYGAGDFDVWLIKIDANGMQEWENTFGGEGFDIAFSVQQTTDGGYILAGETDTYGAGDFDVWLIKTDANGMQEWEETFGGNEKDKAFSVQQTTEGGYILAGWTWSFNQTGIYGDCWLIKTDANGLQEWDRTFGGSDNDSARCVRQTTDGGYVIAANTNSYGAGDRDVWLIKTDANGELTPDPDIEVNPEEFVMQMNSNEIFTDQFAISNISSGTIDYSIDINYLSGNNWMTVDPEFGELEENETDIIEVTFDTSDLTEGLYQSEIVITYGRNEIIIPVSLTVSQTDTDENIVASVTKLIGNYPNPFNPTTTISFQINNEQNKQAELFIYNLKGQMIKRYEINNLKSGLNEIVWNGLDKNNQNAPSGVYLYKLQAGEFSQMKKMILMK